MIGVDRIKGDCWALA